ncbi:MAG: peptidoglycan-binding protein [Leptolyngbya sp. SIO4C1]|nr:peptidoglycan-binding protein [Leptolyngbya sp. SIO4C1]
MDLTTFKTSSGITRLAKFGLASAVLTASAIALPQPAMAQTNSVNEPAAAAPASIEIDQYSPETAPLLYQGRSGEAVEAVQQILQREGFYSGIVDGVYGSRTVSSVITFQRSRNLSADGLVGENTWEALIDAYRRTAPDAGEQVITEYNPETAPLLAYGIRGPAVEAVQAFLKENNYYTGAVDGVYGSGTRAAVRAFQDGYIGLEPDGVVGEATWTSFIQVAEAKG